MSVSLYGSGNTVIQVVSSVFTSGFTTSTTGSWVATGFTASITPQSTNSQILVTTGGFNVNNSGTVNYNVGLFRGSTQIPSTNTGFSGLYYTGNGGELQGTTICYLDSPSTTSSIIYQLYIYLYSGGSAQLNTTFPGGITGVGTITLMEISGS
jgi:hypothetical protein